MGNAKDKILGFSDKRFIQTKKIKTMSATRPQIHTPNLPIIGQLPPNPAIYEAEFGPQDKSATQHCVIYPGRIQSNNDIYFYCDFGVLFGNSAPDFLAHIRINSRG